MREDAERRRVLVEHWGTIGGHAAALVVGVAVTFGAFALPPLSPPREGHRRSDRSRAIATLRDLWSAQNRFREGTRRHGEPRFGTLVELRAGGMVAALDGGARYDFELHRSTAEPGARWAAVARPRIEGDEWLVMNQFGWLFVASRRPTFGDDCEVPPGCSPLGK